MCMLNLFLIYALAIALLPLVLVIALSLGEFDKESGNHNALNIEVSGDELIKDDLEMVNDEMSENVLPRLDKAMKRKTIRKYENKKSHNFAWLDKMGTSQTKVDYWDWPLEGILEVKNENSYKKRHSDSGKSMEDEYIMDEIRTATEKDRLEENMRAFNDSWRHSPEKDFLEALNNHTLCSEDERLSLGPTGLICALKDLKYNDGQPFAGKQIAKIMALWTALLYIFYVIPCWCFKGWFIWCCPCKICSVGKMMEDHRNFIAENPPGIEKMKNGKVIEYEPIPNELAYYDRLNYLINTF